MGTGSCRGNLSLPRYKYLELRSSSCSLGFGGRPPLDDDANDEGDDDDDDDDDDVDVVDDEQEEDARAAGYLASSGLNLEILESRGETWWDGGFGDVVFVKDKKKPGREALVIHYKNVVSSGAVWRPHLDRRTPQQLRTSSPDNILVDQYGDGKLADFGMSIKARDASRRESIGDGTPEYCAPETFTFRGASVASEVYAVADIFVEALANNCPFGSKELLEAAADRLSDLEGKRDDLVELVEFEKGMEDGGLEGEEKEEEGGDDGNDTDEKSAEERLELIPIKGHRLSLVDEDEWAPNDAAIAIDARREAQANPRKLFEDNWGEWLTTFSRAACDEGIRPAVEVVHDRGMLIPDPGSRPHAAGAAKLVLLDALTNVYDAAEGAWDEKRERHFMRKTAGKARLLLARAMPPAARASQSEIERTEELRRFWWVFAVATSDLTREDCNWYASHYCEENAVRLCAHLLDRAEASDVELFVVFVSNQARQVPVWNQLLADSRDEPVLWDYHVVLLTKHPHGNWVYDLDSTLAFPTQAAQYMTQAFRRGHRMQERFRQKFRVVAGRECVDHFSSDRSHMMQRGGAYSARPPPLTPLRGPRSSSDNNMDEWIRMDAASGRGRVMSLDEMEAFVAHAPHRYT
eukprot:g8230.t2